MGYEAGGFALLSCCTPTAPDIGNSRRLGQAIPANRGEPGLSFHGWSLHQIELDADVGDGFDDAQPRCGLASALCGLQFVSTGRRPATQVLNASGDGRNEA
jgi:hypothetical protein